MVPGKTMETIQDYDATTIQHVPGKANVPADVFSGCETHIHSGTPHSGFTMPLNST